jgi:hypothetical protein
MPVPPVALLLTGRCAWVCMAATCCCAGIDPLMVQLIHHRVAATLAKTDCPAAALAAGSAAAVPAAAAPAPAVACSSE